MEVRCDSLHFLATLTSYGIISEGIGAVHCYCIEAVIDSPTAYHERWNVLKAPIGRIYVLVLRGNKHKAIADHIIGPYLICFWYSFRIGTCLKETLNAVEGETSGISATQKAILTGEVILCSFTVFMTVLIPAMIKEFKRQSLFM